jgi:hypothetical protein
MPKYDGASILMGLQFGFETFFALQLAISFYFPIRPFPFSWASLSTSLLAYHLGAASVLHILSHSETELTSTP